MYSTPQKRCLQRVRPENGELDIGLTEVLG